MLDFFAAILIQKQLYPAAMAGDWWISYMEDCFARSPLLREVLDGRQAWYRDELYDIKRRTEERMASTLQAPERPVSRTASTVDKPS